MFLFDPIDSPEKFKNLTAFEEYTIALNYDRVKENDPQRHVATDLTILYRRLKPVMLPIRRI